MKASGLGSMGKGELAKVPDQKKKKDFSKMQKGQSG
jgi:hypothetical protein